MAVAPCVLKRVSRPRPSVVSIAGLPINYRRSALVSQPANLDKLKGVTIDDKKKLRDKIIYTLICNYIHMLFGVTYSSMAPAYVDYREVVHTDIQWILLLPTFNAIGVFIGSFMLSVVIAIQATAAILQPWSTQLWQLYLSIFIYGFGIGAWNGTINVILIEMWQSKSPSILQLSQFWWGVGSVIGPLLTKNFVLGEQICPGFLEEAMNAECIGNSTVFQNFTKLSNGLSCMECRDFDRRPLLKMPLLIGGSLQMIGPAMMLSMFFIKRYHFDHADAIEAVETDEQKARYDKYVPKKTIIVCIILFLMFGIMTEFMYMDFAPTFYQFCDARLTASEATQLFGIMAIALAVGRALSIFIAMKLQPWHMISYQSVIVLIGFVFQYFGQDSYALLLASSLVICFGYSSIFICLFSFVGQYMEVTDKIGILFIASYNVVYMILPYFVGRFIETNAPSFILMEFCFYCFATLSFIVVMIAVWNVPEDLIRKIAPGGGH